MNNREKGTLLWAVFSIDKSEQGSTLDRVDYKNIRKFEKVVKGQTLLSFIPDEKGLVRLADIEDYKGRNVVISDDNISISSEIDGYAYKSNDRIHVDDVYHVLGDVGYETGNIRFDGPVIINGDVLSGFRVEAEGDVEIGGNVGAAEVYSQSGSITVNNGIVGLGRAKLLASKNIYCGFIQDANVGARGDIEGKKYRFNSEISSGGYIIVKEDEGVVRGGSLFARSTIEANVIGSENQIHTEIQVSDHSANPLLAEMDKAREELEDAINTHKRFIKQEEFLLLLKSRLKNLSPEKLIELEQLKNRKELVLVKQEKIEKRLAEIKAEALGKSNDEKVKIINFLYPGVKFIINGIELYSDEKYSKVSVVFTEDKIEFR